MFRSALVFASLATFVLSFSVERALALTITVSPPQPTVQDSVKVTVANDFASLCWTDSAPSCTSGAPDSLLMTVPLQYCGGAPSCICGQFPKHYSRTCNFGLLPAGSYVVRVTEEHINPADPIATETRYFALNVDAPTPTLRRTWGSVKLIYR